MVSISIDGSLGIPAKTLVGLEQSFDELSRHGIMLVIASGNDGRRFEDDRTLSGFSPPRATDASNGRFADADAALEPTKREGDGKVPLLSAVSNLAVPVNAKAGTVQAEIAHPDTNYGPRVRVGAPGGVVNENGRPPAFNLNNPLTGILSLHTNGKVVSVTGTSHATPHVSGLLAEMLYLSNLLAGPINPGVGLLTNQKQAVGEPELTPGERARRARALVLLKLMEDSADDVLIDPRTRETNEDKQGFGRINHYRALLATWNHFRKSDPLIGLTVRLAVKSDDEGRWKRYYKTDLSGRTLGGLQPLADSLPLDLNDDGRLDPVLERFGNRSLPRLGQAPVGRTLLYLGLGGADDRFRYPGGFSKDSPTDLSATVTLHRRDFFAHRTSEGGDRQAWPGGALLAFRSRAALADSHYPTFHSLRLPDPAAIKTDVDGGPGSRYVNLRRTLDHLQIRIAHRLVVRELPDRMLQPTVSWPGVPRSLGSHAKLLLTSLT